MPSVLLGYTVVVPFVLGGLTILVLGVIALVFAHLGRAGSRSRLALWVVGGVALLGGVVLLALVDLGYRAPCRGAPDAGPSPSIAWEREAGGPSMPLALVDFDGERLPQTGDIRVDVDTWDLSSESAVPLDPERLAVLIDERWIPGSFVVQTFRQHGDALALTVVVAGDERVEPLLPVIDRALAALGAARQGQAPAEVIGVWSDGTRVAEPPGKASIARSPDPIGVLTRVLEQIERRDAELPQVRHVLLIGNAGAAAGAAATTDAKALTRVADRAWNVGARIDVIVVGDDGPAPSASGRLAELAGLTGGTLRWVATAQIDPGLGATLATFARELDSRWVVTFTPSDYCGEERPVRFELAARTGDGRFGRASVEEVKIVRGPLD